MEPSLKRALVADDVFRFKELRPNMEMVDGFGWTWLHFTASLGCMNLLEMFITDGPLQVNMEDREGNSPAHLAAKGGKIKALKLLLAEDARLGLGVIRSTSLHGFTLLIVAAMYGFVDIVTMLIDARADINAADLEGRTALHWATIHDYIPVACLLIKRGANPRLRDVHRETPLSAARTRQSTKAMLDELVHLNDCMMESATRLNIVQVTKLISMGACVDYTDDEGWTALMWGALCGSLDMVELLITKGASLHLRNKAGQTVADLAKADGMDRLLSANNDLLACACCPDVNLQDIQHFAKIAFVDAQDDLKMTALMWASYFGRADVVRYLVKDAKARADVVDALGECCLFHAVRGAAVRERFARLMEEAREKQPHLEFSHVDTMDALLQIRGSTVRCFRNRSLLRASVEANCVPLVEYFVQRDEALEELDCALYDAVKCGSANAATYLLSMGANRSFIPAHETRSAIEVATTRGYILCMVALLDSPQTTITRTRHYKQVRRVDPESLEPPLAPEKRGSGFSQPHKKHSAKGSRKSEAPDDASYTSRGTLFSPCKPGFPDMQARDDSESADLPPQSSVTKFTTSKSGNRCSGSLAIDAEFPPDFVVGTNNGVLPSLTTDDDNAPTSSGSKVKDEDLRSKDDDDCATKKTPRGMMIKSRAKKRSRREWELEAAARDCVIVDVYNVASRVEKPAPVEQICRANGEHIVSIAVKGRSWDAIKFLVDRRARCCLTPSDLEKARALTTDESLIRLLHAPLTTMV